MFRSYNNKNSKIEFKGTLVPIGEMIFDDVACHYIVNEKIGHGGDATVYSACCA